MIISLRGLLELNQKLNHIHLFNQILGYLLRDNYHYNEK
jgi:hypothetical protein